MSDSNNKNVETVSTTDIYNITADDINGLLEYFSKNSYTASAQNAEANSFLENVIGLMKMDYGVVVVDNSNGELCPHYPSKIPILEHENGSNHHLPFSQSAHGTTDTIYESIHDAQEIRDQFFRSKFARCRARFPVPVILYRGKYICRSATLSGTPEIYGRLGLEYITAYWQGTNEAPAEPDIEEEIEDSELEPEVPPSQSDWQLYDEVRNEDVRLLKQLNVGTIVDLMVEKRKVKYGLYVSSSEKVDQENRYVDFNLISFPYPGCEFFRDFKDNCLAGDGLVFDWGQGMCDAELKVPDNPSLAHLKFDWSDYKEWDIPTITKNYIKYILKHYQDSGSGLLVHCISGWDRTPLYISILRLSLWADGLIHQSLNEYQIVYLTVAYDWILFGHRLVDRLRKGEHIFFFCFYMMKFLADQEFSIAPRHRRRLTDRVSEESIARADQEAQMDLESDKLSTNGDSPLKKSPRQSEVTNGSNGHHLEVRDNSPVGSSTSPQGKRTSPVPVPESKHKRTDGTSASPGSSSSWHLVSTTGSVKGESPGKSDRHSSLSNYMDLEDYDTPQVNRSDRLNKVREIFYRAYFHVIGTDNVRCAPEDNLIESVISSIASSIAETIGLSPRT